MFGICIGYAFPRHRFLFSLLVSALFPSFKMAARMLARRVTSQLPSTLRSASGPERTISARAFASPAKAQDDSTTVEVGRAMSNSSKGQPERSVAKQQQGTQERAVTNRGWPVSSVPSLFSPLFNFPATFMHPTSLMQMMDTVDRLFSSLDAPTSSTGVKSRIPWDVMEDDKCFKLRMDLPGMSKQDVQITVEDGDLVVKAEHETKEDEDEWSARSYGAYHTRIKLTENVDVNGIKAEMKDGVLKIQAPKVEGAKEKHEVRIE
ncbi:hypothetical protein GOP47_0020609 [Adiantum capillus-veneris]|uniref:SHSP domain-containing protein n=1 Tax=Adiantum capillus-veneris TaxID=13818 RepID=A0A9D4Z749_ADICA|nr:hypothetical protein GOP47_0020609 [Adiantum capillus-veneris]